MNANEEGYWLEPYSRDRVTIVQAWVAMVRNTRQHRFLLATLWKRDFLGRFKRMFLGYAWLFIGPIMGVVSWIALQTAGVLNPGDTGVPYPVYVLIGSSIWGLFMGFFSASSDGLASGMSLISQVQFPHEVLILVQNLQLIGNFLITFGVNVIVFLLFGLIPNWYWFLFPVVLLPLCFLGTALGLLDGLLGVVAPDVKKLTSVGLGLLMYVTPIIYGSNPESPFLAFLVRLNPLTYLVCSARDILLFGRLYEPNFFFLSSLLSLILLVWCGRLFYRSEQRLLERAF